MRPLRLLLDGFGSYRNPADADFSDVDFFALIGPTGSGKSTLIDGLCFALYGTVPRWGKENVIAQALAPGANSCKVCLVFEAAGKRYAAVRALTRDKKGLVHTKEARLERLDPAVPANSSIDDILAASVEQLAEGPDQVKDRVQDILGLSYEHFTQSVLLPQGQFAAFLQAKAAARQDLLVELLAFGVYAKVGQLARERAKLAAGRLRSAQSERAELAEASIDSERTVVARLETLTGLQGDVEDRLTALTGLADRARDAHSEAARAREQTGLLAAIQPPAGVAGLAQRIADADQAVAAGEAKSAAADGDEADAESARDQLPGKSRLEAFRTTYVQHGELAAQLRRQEADLAAKQAGEAESAEKLAGAERTADQARAELESAQNAHTAVHLAGTLEVGGQCPVCLQPVTALPHHRVPADLATAMSAAARAEKDKARAAKAHADAVSAAVAAGSSVTATRERIEQLTASLTEAPSAAEVDASLAGIAAADEALRQARAQARQQRVALSTAKADRASLTAAEVQARNVLGTARDSVVSLGAPAVDGLDLAAAWAALAAWAAAQHSQRLDRQRELDEARTALDRQVAAGTNAISALLVGSGITGTVDVTRAPAVVAEARARADGDLAAIRQSLQKAARLDEQIKAHHEEEQVASMLGNMLRANSFERWLCGEALDSLMTEASQTLMELSGGQYQLDRDDRNELMVIDYQDAASRRPVHTLSGGETFQASLALALALSRQVTSLSAGLRDLNSMFLDEGFGTLDEETLETVATTLERLATDSDRMIGVVTHVPALAERVPVRFVVSHAGGSSAIRKERS
jgi:DNA repair protein SbcC/Rad50